MISLYTCSCEQDASVQAYAVRTLEMLRGVALCNSVKSSEVACSYLLNALPLVNSLLSTFAGAGMAPVVTRILCVYECTACNQLPFMAAAQMDLFFQLAMTCLRTFIECTKSHGADRTGSTLDSDHLIIIFSTLRHILNKELLGTAAADIRPSPVPSSITATQFCLLSLGALLPVLQGPTLEYAVVCRSFFIFFRDLAASAADTVAILPVEQQGHILTIFRTALQHRDPAVLAVGLQAVLVVGEAAVRRLEMQRAAVSSDATNSLPLQLFAAVLRVVCHPDPAQRVDLAAGHNDAVIAALQPLISFAMRTPMPGFDSAFHAVVSDVVKDLQMAGADASSVAAAFQKVWLAAVRPAVPLMPPDHKAVALMVSALSATVSSR